jgi:hypothetical protein
MAVPTVDESVTLRQAVAFQPNFFACCRYEVIGVQNGFSTVKLNAKPRNILKGVENTITILKKPLEILVEPKLYIHKRT